MGAHGAQHSRGINGLGCKLVSSAGDIHQWGVTRTLAAFPGCVNFLADTPSAGLRIQGQVL